MGIPGVTLLLTRVKSSDNSVGMETKLEATVERLGFKVGNGMSCKLGCYRHLPGLGFQSFLLAIRTE